MELSGPEFIGLDELEAKIQASLTTDQEQNQAYASISLAYTLVASWLGTEQLQERVATQLRVFPRQSNLLELTDGPLASIANLTSLTINGTAFDLNDIARFSSWCLVRLDTSFARGQRVGLTFLAGYRIDSDGSMTMPERVRQAILATAADAYMNPNLRKIMEKIGDYQYQLAGGGFPVENPLDFVIPASAQLLLRDYKRTR